MTLKTLMTVGTAVLASVLPTCLPAHALAQADGSRTSTVKVPLDRANPAAGTLGLAVTKLPATGRKRGTLLYLSGGPGGSARAEVRDVLFGLGSAVRRRYDVVAFDARGTGRSGLIVCPELQRDRTLRSTSAAAACAARLGARRGLYTTDAQVEDIEAVRKALGIERLTLFGISYGTEVALRYASAYPDRVGRVALDSVLPPEGPSALGLELFSGMPRVLGTLCARGACPRGVGSPARTVPQLVARLRAAPLRARVFQARGGSRTATLDRVALLDLLLAGDFSQGLRAALPSAVAAAVRGDAAPLLRLRQLDRDLSPPSRAAEFSNGAYAATSCEQLALPWDGAADPATRRAQAAARLAELGDAPFAPFDAETILDADFLPLCLGWPAQQRPAPTVFPPIPPVPMLLVEGGQDLRTPVESARVVAARNPRAKLLVVPGVGHSTSTADPTRCAARAIRAFLLATRGPASCKGPGKSVPPVPVPPATAEAFGTAPTAKARAARTIRALDATFDDVVLAGSVGSYRGGGLRGGRYEYVARGVELHRYAYVPGIVFDAHPVRGGRYRVRVRGRAAAGGTLTVTRRGLVTGRLGGRAVRGRLRTGPPAP